MLIAPSSDYYQVVVEAETQVRQALAIDVNGKGLGIGALPWCARSGQLFSNILERVSTVAASNLTFNSSQPIKITVRLPEGVLQYTELNFVNSDLLINVTFSKSKGEIVKRGNGTMVITGLNSDLAKFSVAG